VTSGVVIRTLNSTKEPLVLELQSTGTNAPYIGFIAEKNITSSLEFLHTDSSKGSCYPLIDYKLHNNSQIDTYIVHDTPKSSSSIASFYAQIEKDASLNVHCVRFGSSLSRVRFDIDLDGVGSNFNIDGVYFGDEDGLIDYRVFVNHNVKNTSSNMLLKGALVDESSTVFTGTIHIAEGAAKTVSHQINRNLILDKRAKAHSVPNLEILCDDVICGHGSSVGPIEEDLFHYVMSRGISRIEAEKLLINGFFNEVLNKDKWKILREYVLKNIQIKYENSLLGVE
jgi:Fe-S cluster assembly protein SufD